MPEPARSQQWEHWAGNGVMLAPACSTGRFVGHHGHAGYLTPAVEDISGVNFKPSRMWRCLFINQRIVKV